MLYWILNLPISSTVGDGIIISYMDAVTGDGFSEVSQNSKKIKNCSFNN